jgi:hypothetical protein
MDKSEMIEALTNHIKLRPMCHFYSECLKIVENMPDGLLTKLSSDEHILETVRITLCYNIDKYKVYIYNKSKKHCTCLSIKMTDEVYEKWIQQIVTVSEYNTVLALYDNVVSLPNIKYRTKNDLNCVYIIVSKKQKQFKANKYELKNLYDCLGYIFGKHSHYFMKHQRFDRIIKFLKSKDDGRKLFELLDNYHNMLKSIDWQDREKYMIFSGATFQALGTTYTDDIDVLLLEENKNIQELENLLLTKETSQKSFDINVLTKDEKWYDVSRFTKKIQTLPYKSKWLTHQLPQLVGADSIFEIASNPKHHFYFMGIKFVSIDMNIKRILMRSNANSLTDLIMLERLNDIHIGDKLCFPNMTIRQGKFVVFDDQTVEKIQNQVVQKLKEYYNYSISINEAKKILNRCNVTSFDIYKGPVVKDHDTGIIKGFHISVKEFLFKKYSNNVDNLLDIGSGQMVDAKSWKLCNIKHVVGVEPSVHSIKNAYANLEKIEYSNNVHIINGVGDEDWRKNPKYSHVYENFYDVISFQFTIHYMFEKIDTLMDNINPVMKSGTKILISCMDGNKIHSSFDKNGRIEIRNYHEPIFAIAAQYDYKQKNIPNNGNILVYFKGAYGLSNGSIENILDVDKLIEIMKQHKIKLIDKKNFIDFDMPLKNKMSPIQKQVSSFYMSLVFEKE